MKKSFYDWPQKACHKIKSALFLRPVYKAQFAVRKVQFEENTYVLTLCDPVCSMCLIVS